MTETYYEIKEDGSKEEIEEDLQETRRLIGPHSYDDNWDLVNYTSELRDSKGKFYAFIDFHGNEGVIKECPYCLKYDLHSKLGAKIKKKDEPIAPDDDQFMSCYQCGNTFPIYETFADSEIRDSLETVQHPFENETDVFLSTDNRATQRRKRERRDHYRKGVHRYKSKRLEQYNEQEDPDIQREIDIHGSDNVRIIQDTDT